MRFWKRKKAVSEIHVGFGGDFDVALCGHVRRPDQQTIEDILSADPERPICRVCHKEVIDLVKRLQEAARPSWRTQGFRQTQEHARKLAEQYSDTVLHRLLSEFIEERLYPAHQEAQMTGVERTEYARGLMHALDWNYRELTALLDKVPTPPSSDQMVSAQYYHGGPGEDPTLTVTYRM